LVAAAVLLPTVAILHATETSSTNTSTASHDSDEHEQNHQDQDHNDNETSDDNSVTHVEVDDANENATDAD
jgi:hypothetical protein